MFSYTQWLDELIKAAGHKYIKRIPYQSGGKMRYRYIYNVTHTHQGKHVLDPAHMKVGTKLMLDATSGAEVHGHIQSVSGDKVTFIYDDGPKKGESVTMSKDKLASELDKVHGISAKLDAARKKEQEKLDVARRSGASSKVLAKIEARIERLKQDIKRDTPSELQKRLLKEHMVTAEGVKSRKMRIERIDPSLRSGAAARKLEKRISLMESEGLEDAVASYNAMLERSATENQDVLTAIEAYKDMIAVRLDDPATLNQVMQAQADNLQSLTVGYGLTPDMTAVDVREALKTEGKYLEFKEDVKQRTGADFDDRASITIKQVCSQGTSQTIKNMEQHKRNAVVAKRAREAIQKHIEKACAEFSFDQIRYKEGQTHQNHQRDKSRRTKRQREAINATSHILAHVEDVFLRAYGERAEHETEITVPSGDDNAVLASMAGNFFYRETSLARSKVSAVRGSKQAVRELAYSLEGKGGERPLYQQRIQDAVTLTHVSRTEDTGVDVGGQRQEFALDGKYSDRNVGLLHSTGESEFVGVGVAQFFDYSTRYFDNEIGKAVDIAPSEYQMKNIADFAITDPHHYLVTYGILKGYAK